MFVMLFPWDCTSHGDLQVASEGPCWLIASRTSMVQFPSNFQIDSKCKRNADYESVVQSSDVKLNISYNISQRRYHWTNRCLS